MPLVVIAGAPGAGKTTLLAEMAKRGHRVVSDSAREVIQERKAAGLPARPGQEEFARAILERDVEKYKSVVGLTGLVFFERCALEALAMLRDASPAGAERAEAELPNFIFHSQVFVLPSWSAIYITDSERDHSFEHAQRVHAQVIKFYPALGYKVVEVPYATAEQRAEYVLRSLSTAGAA